MTRWQLRLAWAQLAISAIGWPVSLIFVDEPKWILSLSWYAIISTSLAYIAAADADRRIEERER